jgi:diguanylate cyclase (GGDEF)-like protein
VYRWGGDEFVVVMVDMPLDLARRRMATLERAANAAPELAALGVPIAVSWGAAEFCDGSSVQKAIEAADAAMYEFKTARKGLAK